uniref:HIT-type domain-containing protein n=1 Tax=Ditylenchus dipsaci TaxID=166011 RepID=A0A915D5S3_9BILA
MSTDIMQSENQAVVNQNASEVSYNLEKQTDVSDELSFKKPRLDGSHCQECHQKISKYNCPKCATRTCSLECCREHKESKNCDGVRPKWTPVPYHSSASYSGKHVVQDKHFIQTIKHALNNLSHLSLPQSIVNCLSGGKSGDQLSDGEERAESPDDLDQLLSAAVDADENLSEKSDGTKQRAPANNLAPMERILLTNATARRIWLTVKDKEDSDGSRYDIHADTIFWTITLKFIRNLGSGGKSIQEEPAGSVLENPATGNGENSDDGEILADDGEISADESDEPILSIAEDHNSEDAISDQEKSLGTEQVKAKAGKSVEESAYTVKNVPETLTVSTLLRQFLKPKENGPLISKADLQMEKMQPFSEAGADGLMLYMKVPCSGKDRYYIVDPSKSMLENLHSEAQELRENLQIESRAQNRPRNFVSNQQRGSNNRGGGQRGWNRNGRGSQSGPRNYQNYNRQPTAQSKDHLNAGQAEIVQQQSPLSEAASSGTLSTPTAQSQSFRRGYSSGGSNQPYFQRRNNFNCGRGGGGQWQQNSGNRGGGNCSGRGFPRRDNNGGRKRFYNDLDNTEESGSGQQRHWEPIKHPLTDLLQSKALVNRISSYRVHFSSQKKQIVVETKILCKFSARSTAHLSHSFVL